MCIRDSVQSGRAVAAEDSREDIGPVGAGTGAVSKNEADIRRIEEEDPGVVLTREPVEGYSVEFYERRHQVPAHYRRGGPARRADASQQ